MHILLFLLVSIGSNAIRVVRQPEVVEMERLGPPVSHPISSTRSGLSDVLHVMAVRHGESEWNHVCEKGLQTPQLLGGILERYVDSPLSKYGLRQVQRLATVVLQAGGLWDKTNKGLHVVKNSSSFNDLYTKVDAAVLEMAMSPPEVQANIAHGDELITIESQAKGLLQEEDALKVLLGEDCDNTLLVTSNLIRAIDTGLFAVLPMQVRRSCPDLKWRMSSNLQEIASNRDSETSIPVGKQPMVHERQRSKYQSTGMLKELEYIKEMYTHADARAHTEEANKKQRVDTGAYLAGKMDAELTELFQQGRKEQIWALHSMWIREFLKRFGDPLDEVCQLASQRKGKMKNTAILRFDVTEQAWSRDDGSEVPFLVTNCRWLFLGEKEVTWTKHSDNKEDAAYELDHDDYNDS